MGKGKKKHDYFSVIDTEFKAYILGWIYADGTLLPRNGNRQALFCISVQEEDGKEFLIELAREITERVPGRRYYASQIKRGEKPQMRVSISSDQIFSDLVGYGLRPAKTKYGMTFPVLNPKLEHHFIRGFLDGDGSIMYSQTIASYVPKTKPKTNKLRDRGRIAFIGTDKLFLEEVRKRLPITKHYYGGKQSKNMFTHILWIERALDVRACIDYLYKDATWFLSRKRKKAIKIISSQALCAHKEGSETTGEVKPS